MSKAKTAELLKHHLPIFEALGIKNPVFYPKPAFKIENKNEKGIPMFPDQISKLMGRDIYIETVDLQYNTEPDWEGNERALWKWTFDPGYKQYPRHTSKGGSEMIMIPVSKLRLVSPTPIQKVVMAEQGKLFDDCPDLTRKVTEMTVGDLKCLLISLIKEIKDE